MNFKAMRKSILIYIAILLFLSLSTFAFSYMIYHDLQESKTALARDKEEIKFLQEDLKNIVRSNSGESEREMFMVQEVVDGDSVKVNIRGKLVEVRLLGINTPEIGNIEECFGQEAKKRALELMLKKKVFLLEDLANTDKDVYGRLLRYVYLADERQVNLMLIQEGYAKYYRHFKIAYGEVYKKSEDEARNNEKGIWSATCS